MPLDDPSKLARQQNHNKLESIKNANRENEPIIAQAEKEDDDLQTHFRYLDALSTGPFVSHLVELERKGIIMSPAEMLNEEELSERLWEVIEGLAECQVFLSSTDHLSDRDLYEHLRTESLIEEHPDLPMGASACIHLDILGGCSDEDIDNHYRYYANEEDRQHWQKDWPDYVMPKHIDPPYDRDQYLPKHRMDRRNEME